MEIIVCSIISAFIVLMINQVFVWSRNKRIQTQTLKFYSDIDASIKIGKKVLASGIFGEIISVENEFITLKLEDNQKVKFARYSITKVF